MRALPSVAFAAFFLCCASCDVRDAGNDTTSDRLAPIEGAVTLSTGGPNFPPGSVIATITNVGKRTFCVRADAKALGNRLRVFNAEGDELDVDVIRYDQPWDSRQANTFSCIPAGDTPIRQYLPIVSGTDFKTIPPGTYTFQFEALAFPVERLAKADPGQPLGFRKPGSGPRKDDTSSTEILTGRRSIEVFK